MPAKSFPPVNTQEIDADRPGSTKVHRITDNGADRICLGHLIDPEGFGRAPHLLADFQITLARQAGNVPIELVEQGIELISFCSR